LYLADGDLLRWPMNISKYIAIRKNLQWSGILILIFLTSCGDLFSYKKNIIDNYYLVEGDNKNDLTICIRADDGVFLRRIPAQIIEYGYTDSFVVGKTKSYTNIESYYIINRKKDSDVTFEKVATIGPIEESEYTRDWSQRINVKLTKVAR